MTPHTARRGPGTPIRGGGRAATPLPPGRACPRPGPLNEGPTRVHTGTRVCTYARLHARYPTGGRLSTPGGSGTPVIRRRAARRADRRPEYWINQVAGAPDGFTAFTHALRWAQAVLARIEDTRPQDAEHARWQLARALATFASQAPLYEFEHRTGLTAEEQWQLLNPWAAPRDDAR